MHRRTTTFLAVLAVLAAGCSREQPLGPDLELSFRRDEAPSGINPVVVAHNWIDVYWQDNSSNETGYELQRATGTSGAFTVLVSLPAGSTAYGNSGLTAQTQYCYRVRAFRRTGKNTTYSAFSNTACATTPIPPPNAPSGTNAVPQSSSSIAVAWTGSSNEDGFRVERSSDGVANWSVVATTSAGVTSVQDDGRASEQQACYRVFAFNARGDSPGSNTDCTTPPTAPTGLTATGLDGPVIDLAWADNSAAEDGYEVRRSSDGVTFAVVAQLAANSASYSDRGVSENATYWYIVAAMKDGGLSDFSTAASAQAGVLRLGRIVTMGNTMMKFTGSAAFRVLLGDDGGDTDDYVFVRNILQQLSSKSSNVRILYTDTCDPRTDPDVCLIGGLEYLQPFYDMISGIGTITYTDIASAQLADFDVVIADFCSLRSDGYDVLRSYLYSGGPAIVLGDNFCWWDFTSSADLANSVIADLGVYFLPYELNEYERLLVPSEEQVGLLSGVSNLGLWRLTPQYISQDFIPIATWNAEVLFTIRSGAAASPLAGSAHAVRPSTTAEPLRAAAPGRTLVESLLRTELRVNLRALKAP